MRFSWILQAMLSVLLGLVYPSPLSRSQEINRNLLEQRWKAQWITCPDGPRREFGLFYFRKTFSLNSLPSHFTVHASGDNRYELFVNGARVLTGPARGDLDHWRYETLDIASELHTGKNVLAAVVWNFAEEAPMAQMTNETGFILQGDGAVEDVVITNRTWKSYKSAALRPIHFDHGPMRGYFVAGPGERVNGSEVPWGWETADYDDAAWKPAIPISPGEPRGIQDSPSRWMLVPRPIPLMEEKLERLARVVRAKGIDVRADFLEGRAPVNVPAGTEVTILLDQTYLTTAYPELVTSGGRGAEIKLTYAEALWNGRDKGNRNETEGKEILGYYDQFLPEGGEHRVFRPLWWRTYRYLQLDVTTQTEPLSLEDLRGLSTAYPLVQRAKFQSDDPELAKIWEVGWRTARLCAHETYMDCPYYEQLQYVGDTRIQALISLYVAGDDRLAKNAIEQINDSRTPQGLTQSRYPSFLEQNIPPFSLFWIGMMRDLWWYRGETEFLKQFLPGTREVLEWFESRLAPSGLLGKLEWWDFVDWTNDFHGGVPPQESDGQSAILSLQFAAALREAADLESNFGDAERARHDRELAARIVQAVHKACWDSSRKLLADTPARKHFSQHANILAVLTDAVPPGEQRRLIQEVLRDRTLTQCSYYFRFYLFRAMKKAGLAEEYLNQLAPWREMLSLGLTTWAEKPEPTRSDCHAWSAHPNFDLLATVAGIEPAAPGFREVRIEPHLGRLNRLTVTMPHPEGEITIEYERQATKVVAVVSLPENLSGTFYWEGKKVLLHSGKQRLVF